MQKIMQAKHILQRHRALFAFGRPPSRSPSIYKFFLVKMIFSGFHFQGFDQNLNKCKDICCSLEFLQGQNCASAISISIICGFDFKLFLFVHFFVCSSRELVQGQTGASASSVDSISKFFRWGSIFPGQDSFRFQL